MVGTTTGGTNKNSTLQSKGVGGRSSPTVPRILSPKKTTGHAAHSQTSSSASNQISKDIARSLFKDSVNKSENATSFNALESIPGKMDKTGRPNESPDTISVIPVINMEESATNTTPSSDASKVIPTLCDQKPRLLVPTVLTNETIILNNDSIATTLAENVSNNSGSGFQSSPSNVMNLSIVNGKIKDGLVENQDFNKPSTCQNEEVGNVKQIDSGSESLKSTEQLEEKSSTLMDLLKPLDGKNIEDIEDESSSALSSCFLKLTRNELGFWSSTGRTVLKQSLILTNPTP